MDPENILGGISECNIFSLGAREGDDRLFLCAPRDCSKSNEVDETGDRVTVAVGSPIHIQKSGNLCIPSQDESKLLHPKQVAKDTFHGLHMSGSWHFKELR